MYDLSQRGKSAEFINRRIKYIAQVDHGGIAGLYEHLNGRAPTSADLKAFNLFLKRGDGGWNFLYLLQEKTRFKGVNLSDLFNVDINNAQLFGDE